MCRNLTIAVNDCASQFTQPNFVEIVGEAARKNGVPPAKLKFEITVSMVLNHVEEAIGKMQQLQASGFSLSLDDFGTGYSSLSYLKMNH